MKALTVQQPWATLLVAGIKDVENRTWQTRHRGRLAIHAAARRFDASAPLPLAPIPVFGALPVGDPFPRGVVLGTVELVDVVQGSPSEWAEEHVWHWLMRDARVLSAALPASGRLGLWDLAETIAEEINNQRGGLSVADLRGDDR